MISRNSFLVIFIALMTVFGACKPTMVMRIGKEVDSERPRFALAERMLFYELEHNNQDLVLRLQTTDAYTKQQLVKYPIYIYIADKNKRGIIYRMEYRDNSSVDSLYVKKKTEPTFHLFRIADKEEREITDSVKLSVKGNSSASFYALRIDFPKNLFNEIEDPVMGIVSKVNRKQYENNLSSQPERNSKERHGATEKGKIMFDEKPEAPVVQQTYTIPSINIWFRIEL